MNVLGPSSIRQAVIAQASASPSVASVASVASDSGKRRVLITGGNTGIGFETAKALAHSHKIIVGARNEAKGKAAVAKLKDAVPGASCELAVFDLADLDSVSDFSKAMLDAGTPLDVLINNAGVMACPLSRTKQGFETQIGVNHLGHFLLTEELLPLIQAAGSNHGDARIVNLASSANYGGTINFDDLNWTKRQYSKWPAYCQSKLANVVRPKPVTTRPDSPRLAPTRPDSPRLAPTRPDSPRLAPTRPDSPRLAPTRPASPTLVVHVRAGQADCKLWGDRQRRAPGSGRDRAGQVPIPIASAGLGGTEDVLYREGCCQAGHARTADASEGCRGKRVCRLLSRRRQRQRQVL
jgi:NADP-dependent 3-hydroxy acid dehydrogenase YdfG